MENLIDLALEVSKLSAVLKDVSANRDRARALKTRAHAIRRISEKAQSVERDRNVLKAAGIQLTAKVAATSQLKKRTQLTAKSFAENWEKTAEDKNLQQNFIDPVNETLDKISKELKKDWEGFVSQAEQAVRREWLHRLPDKAFGKTKQKMSSIEAELAGIKRTIPEDPSSVVRVTEIVEEAAPILAELENTPQSVREFLAKADSGRAVIEDLTEEVRTWLAKQEMLGLLRIKIG